MQQFAQLVQTLQNTTKTNDKKDALVNYLATAPDTDKVWLIALFTGRRPKRLVNSGILAYWALQKANLPEWLFSESYHTVGDLAETITLILPAPVSEENISLADVMLQIRKLEKSTDEE